MYRIAFIQRENYTLLPKKKSKCILQEQTTWFVSATVCSKHSVLPPSENLFLAENHVKIASHMPVVHLIAPLKYTYLGSNSCESCFTKQDFVFL